MFHKILGPQFSNKKGEAHRQKRSLQCCPTRGTGSSLDSAWWMGAGASDGMGLKFTVSYDDHVFFFFKYIYIYIYLIEAHENHETSQSHIDIMITLFCVMVTFFRLAASLLFPTNHFCPNSSGSSSREG